MTAGTVLLWRHGQTDYNAAGRLQGQVDIPLNQTGIAQAQAAARLLAASRPSVIVASDLVRAHATAQVLGELTDTAVSTDTRLRERSFGEWEGLTHDQVAQGWPEQFDVWRSGGYPEGVGAETRGDVGHRFAAAIQECSDALGEQDVLVVTSHGAAIGIGISALLGLDPESSHVISGIGNCHWSVLRHNASHGQPWRLAGHNLGAPDSDFARAARIV
ncbi:histidine phosphatase family protein [Ruania halotolerans]|uniref:histidine phosphatase family protein n=1 Tax=Ruania halotolerans TaxID=2897773 RepID=UPI001E495245|nr:histidine phosphatase family protein [Ruania halotolerans]UFU07886.1 histidine phosphatase family protein [Ruania halotolerans]